MIHKNLTPFYWGPKVTSRTPPQPEMAVCVRGVFKLMPGQPLEAIEDPIDQGFMSGELFAVEDIDQAGALLYPGDFADWKPFGEVLLKGTAYPPKGSDVACDVSFGVGDWSKTLRVVGPRTFKPGMLFGGSASDPEPFTHMPLTWENAYGGEGYGLNPVGKGYKSPELPTIERPDQPITKTGAKGVEPACFLPISSHWAQRKGKRGKKYGKKWRATRYPFVSEDFDWTYFNVAPEDQRLPDYLRGDEEISFTNLHPEHRSWSARLPALRIRALVRTDDELIHDLVMRLDTLYADMDAGRLYLTWRGHAPIREIDMADALAVLVASEPLASDPLPLEHYEKLLLEFEDDPIGLKTAFPPGFLEVAKAIEAAELADLNGTPKPDLKKLAANLPAGCPFPPWFLAAAAGDPDPLGIKKQLPASFFGPDPMKSILLENGLPEELADASKRDALMAKLSAPKANAAASVGGLAAVAAVLPPDAREGFLATLAETKKAMSVAKVPPAAPPPPTGAAQMAALKQKGVELAKVGDGGSPGAEGIQDVPTLDETVAKLLEPLDKIEMPELPDPIAAEADLMAQKAKLVLQEKTLRGRGITSPMLGMFALGHRLIDKAPRPADCMPDMTPMIEGLTVAKVTLADQGVSAVALAPLTGLIGRVTSLRDAVPLRPKPEKRDYAYGKLAGQDFSGQNLSGKSFACADLQRANLSGADLSGADLTEAKLSGANLTGANLKGAILTKANLTRATLVGVDLQGSNLRGAELAEANLGGVNASGADAQGATLEKTVLKGATLVGMSLIDADLSEADLSGADLTGARMESARAGKAKFSGAKLIEADLRFADLSKADLSKADLSKADLSLAMLDKVRADGANFSGAKLDMAKITKSRLQETNFTGATAEMAFFTGSNFTKALLQKVAFTKCDLSGTNLAQADFSESTLRGVIFRDVTGHGTRFVKADIGGTSTTGKSSFRDANFAGIEARRTVWQDADLRDADFSYANLTESYFSNANVEGTNFFGATLKNASLMKARLIKTRFVSADLCGADLTHTKMIDSQFTKANCYDVKFLGAEIASCDFLEANLTAAQFDPDHEERG